MITYEILILDGSVLRELVVISYLKNNMASRAFFTSESVI